MHTIFGFMNRSRPTPPQTGGSLSAISAGVQAAKSREGRFGLSGSEPDAYESSRNSASFAKTSPEQYDGPTHVQQGSAYKGRKRR